MSDTDEPDFYGVLGKITSRDGEVALRFYPFVFSTEIDARPVFSVRFEGPRFAASEIKTLVDRELEITVWVNRAELYDVFDGEMIVLEAKSVTAGSATYDSEDFAHRIQKLDAEYEHLNRRIVQLVGKQRKLESVTDELLRRAQIKAAASDEHRTRQAAAIDVLKRIARELAGDT